MLQFVPERSDVRVASRGRGSQVGLLLCFLLTVLVATAAEPPIIRSTGEPELAPVQEDAIQPTTGNDAAQPLPPGDRLVNNVFFETDIKQALADVASQTSTIIIPDETVQGFVTMELRDMPLTRALRLLLLPGGYAYEEVEPGVYLVISADPEGPNFPRIARTTVVELDYIRSSELRQQMPDIFGRYIKYDEEGNRAVVTAPPELMAQAIAQIEALDTPPLQIMIEALVVETTGGLRDEFELGVQGRHLGLDTRTGLATYVGNAAALLHRVLALVTNEEGTIKATPRVVTQEGRQANVKVAIEQYFSLVSGRLGFEYVRLEAIEAAVGLTITPHVALADNMVTCTIEPEVGDVTGIGPDNLPIITRRTASTTVRVEDGQIIAIGGLLQVIEREIHRKIPILGDIPIIGGLFRSKEDTTQQREITIFIVPHILNDNGEFTGPLLSERVDLPLPPPDNAPAPREDVPPQPTPQARDSSLRR